MESNRLLSAPSPIVKDLVILACEASQFVGANPAVSIVNMIGYAH
jgi:hypothetical protein